MKSTAPTKADRQTYRRMLLDKRQAVTAGLTTKFDTMARMGRVAEDDQAQLIHDESVHLQLNGMDYRQLRMVDEALDRLKSGDYGVCLACEEPIAPKRLKALPWARYCVACEDAVDRQTDSELVPAAG